MRFIYGRKFDHVFNKYPKVDEDFESCKILSRIYSKTVHIILKTFNFQIA